MTQRGSVISRKRKVVSCGSVARGPVSSCRDHILRQPSAFPMAESRGPRELEAEARVGC